VIRGVEVCCGDLVSAPKRKSDSSPQMKAPQDEAGRYKILLLAIVLSVLKECRVELDFRPEFPK